MKTTKIFFAVLIAALLAGCNNELNLVGSYDDSGIKHYSVSENKNMQLLWKYDELSVKISNENMAENKVVFNNVPFMHPEDYLITFDVFTDANEYTNGYSPTVKITMDQETVYEAHSFPDLNPQGICYREVNLDNVRFDNLTFYVSLYKIPNVPPLQFSDGCCLKLLNLKVYLLN